jgi:hypothetical protein
MKWRVDTPALLKEMVDGNPSGGILVQPVNIFRQILTSLAERAIELDDPALNVLMLRLALYEVPPTQISERIAEQEARLS